jgi:hypothetical protein
MALWRGRRINWSNGRVTGVNLKDLAAGDTNAQQCYIEPSNRAFGLLGWAKLGYKLCATNLG